MAHGMQLDLQLNASPTRSRRHAGELTGIADGLFTFDGSHDAFLPLALAATATDARLMTNIAVALTRSPVHLAHMARDLHELSQGRFQLGLGSQVRAHIEHRYGVTWSRPAARMREIVLAVKEILASWQEERSPEFRGEFTRHTLMTPAFAPPPNPYGVPPVLLGALGPLMTRTAAEVADGLLVMPFNSVRHFQQRTLPAIESGLARAQRSIDSFEIVPQAMVALGDTPAELERAVAGVRSLVAFYGSTPAYLPVLEAEGRADLQPALNSASKAGAHDEMAALIDDELLRAVAVIGSPRDVATEIKARFGLHAQRVCAYFPGYEVNPDLVRELSTQLRSG